jgi:hypothetical protein
MNGLLGMKIGVTVYVVGLVILIFCIAFGPAWELAFYVWMFGGLAALAVGMVWST